MSTRARRRLGRAGLVGLTVACLLLAAPGDDLVPATVGGSPGWLQGPFGSGLGISGAAYLVALVVAFAAYLAVVAGAPALGRRTIRAATTGLLVLFALAPPLLSQDVFSYIAYARLAVDGLSPYSSVPLDAPGDVVVAYVGWRDTTSAYGPLFSLITFPLGAASVPVALWALKAVAAAAVAGTAALVGRLAAVRGVDPVAAVAFVALNPLVLVHVVGGAHNDGLLALGLVFAIAAIAAGRARTGGALIVGAAAIKASGAFALPFAVLGARPGKRTGVAAGAVGAVGVVALVSLAAFGTDVLSSFALVGENQALTSRYSVPAQLSRIAGVDLGVMRGLATALFAPVVAGLAWWTSQGADWVRAAGWAGFALLLATGWLLPWYVIWILPFAALGRDRPLAALTLALCAFQLINRIPL
ncbi:MAG: polyprenol phosphomannose-dependent alpha 1,6 mannosyltransferase MptB [Solirubrobacterales bacterium]